MLRGFVTIATGDKHYYLIAYNLLRSYRLHADVVYPFAILCEEENEYTKQFDNVVIIQEPRHSFLDKITLLKLCPYEENIFIDADSLAYGDLNQYWDLFKDATDFSSIGDNLSKDQEDLSWYDIKDIGKYGEIIDYIVRIHSGVCFIRNNPSLNKMFDDCMDICNNYHTIKVRLSPWCTDEAIFDIAMPMNEMFAVPEDTDLMGYLPCLSEYEIDMWRGDCKYTTIYGKHSDNGSLIHFSNKKTYEYFYMIEVLKMSVLLGERNPICIRLLGIFKQYYKFKRKIDILVHSWSRKIHVKMGLIKKSLIKKVRR